MNNGIRTLLFAACLIFGASAIADEAADPEAKIQAPEPTVGSWTFSGTVTNESGERFGYFFQMQRQGSNFHAKTALIDGQTNKLLLFYEGDEKIDEASALDWHVGRSFMRHNPINDSWIFGLKLEDKKGFNFKVDMLKQANNEEETLVLRPGVELQALQTSRLNGNVQIGVDNKEQFVTGNRAWFGKLWFSKDQKTAHDISTTFCRLGNDNGFYSANLKESDATGAAVAGWRDASGGKVKMSQFVSIKNIGNNESLLHVGLPKLRLKLFNTLKTADKSPLWLAGFSKDKDNQAGFCYVAEQSFASDKQTG
jgi:hypothetical protein